MTASRRHLRKAALLAHVLSSVGWVGSVLTFIGVVLVGMNGATDALVRGAFLAAGVVVQFVIVPFALAAVASGVLASWASPWGLLRHYWVIIKLLLTVGATAVLLVELRPISAVAGLAAAPGGEFPTVSAGVSMLVHGVGAVLVLLVTLVLAVYKPRGTT